MDKILCLSRISYEERSFDYDCCEQSITRQSARSQETAANATE